MHINAFFVIKKLQWIYNPNVMSNLLINQSGFLINEEIRESGAVDKPHAIFSLIKFFDWNCSVLISH